MGRADMIDMNLGIKGEENKRPPKNAREDKADRDDVDAAANRASELKKIIDNSDSEDKTIRTGKGDDEITNTNSKNTTIRTREGNDEINNDDSDGTTIRAGKGDDVINNKNSKDSTIRAGIGNDVINNEGSDNTIIYARRGDDVINTDTLGSNTIRASRGDDVINVSVQEGSETNPNGTLTIKGGAGNDKVVLSGKKEDYEIDKKGDYVHIDTGARIKINNKVEEVEFQESSTNNSATATETASSSATTNIGPGMEYPQNDTRHSDMSEALASVGSASERDSGASLIDPSDSTTSAVIAASAVEDAESEKQITATDLNILDSSIEEQTATPDEANSGITDSPISTRNPVLSGLISSRASVLSRLISLESEIIKLEAEAGQ
ncbi:MAG: calcium-binding protein [Candidatus Melainabacteria bacterium]|nr:calcium-binding protein [Candidatus Melainabacteria bacterium]